MTPHFTPRDGKAITDGGSKRRMRPPGQPSVSGNGVSQAVARFSGGPSSSLVVRPIGPSNSSHFVPHNLRKHLSRSGQLVLQLAFRTSWQVLVCTTVALEADPFPDEAPDFIRVKQTCSLDRIPIRPSSDPIRDDEHGCRESEVPEDRVCELCEVAEAVVERNGERPRGPLPHQREFCGFVRGYAAPAVCVKAVHVPLEAIYVYAETVGGLAGVTGEDLVVKQDRNAWKTQRRPPRPSSPPMAAKLPARSSRITSRPNRNGAPTLQNAILFAMEP